MTRTPSEKWYDSIERYRNKCQSILKISNNIRYVGAVNVYGKTLAGIIKPNVKPIMKPEIIKNELFIISTLMNLRKENTKILGNLNYTLLNHNNMSIIIFQKNNIVYYITLDKKEKGIDQVIASIKKMI